VGTARRRDDLHFHLGKFGGGIRVAIEDEQDCSSALQQIAACRGAINNLLVEIIDGEIRFHVLSKNSKVDSREAKAAENLVKILHRYIK
jgi:DNA-binding FrmR family transcriptional regulator